jgi:hypothetical protein
MGFRNATERRRAVPRHRLNHADIIFQDIEALPKGEASPWHGTCFVTISIGFFRGFAPEGLADHGLRQESSRRN